MSDTRRAVATDSLRYRWNCGSGGHTQATRLKESSVDGCPRYVTAPQITTEVMAEVRSPDRVFASICPNF